MNAVTHSDARSDITLSDLAADWILDCQHRDLSPRTITAYTSAAKLYIASQGADLASFDRASVRKWLATMRHLKPVTISTRLSAIKAFGSFLRDEKILTENPIAGLRGPKVTVEPVDPFTPEDIAAMISQCPRSGFTGRRNMAIITMLAETGLRLEECATLKVYMIDMDSKVIALVQGKGKKPRMIPYGEKVRRALFKYLRERDKQLAGKEWESDYLWLGERDPFLSRSGIDKMLRRTARKAGVKGARAHRFRNTSAINMLEAGMSESSVMSIFGWSSATMLQRYSKAKRAELADQEFRKLFG